MSSINLRKKTRICYSEYEEPDLDEYIFCSECADYVYEYCAIHGPLLVVPDTEVPAETGLPPHVPRSALTIPGHFLHINHSHIPGAGLGVFASLTLPGGVRFGPYAGARAPQPHSDYCWQIYDRDRKPRHVVDGADPTTSNWMRFVNCARHSREQNLAAFQFRGEIYYRTLRVIPRYSELLVYYGAEFAARLGIKARLYNSLRHYPAAVGIAVNSSVPPAARGHPPADDPVPAAAQTQGAVHTPSPPETPQRTQNNDDLGKDGNKCIKPSKDIIQQTPDKCQLKKEVIMRTGEKPFSCDSCYYKTTRSSNLKTHVRTHTGEKPFSCDSCDYKTTQRSHLKTHVRTHTGEKPFSCDSCDYKTTHSGTLKRHLRTHTGEKPFSCDFCDYKTTWSSALKTHVRNHTGEKPFSCDFCDYKTTWSSALKTHVRTHTGEKPFSCDFCDYKTTQSGTLKTHVITHTGEKPFSCNSCDYKTTKNSNLKTHVRTHTGEKSFICDFCDYKTTSSSSLNVHLRRHMSKSVD